MNLNQNLVTGIISFKDLMDDRWTLVQVMFGGVLHQVNLTQTNVIEVL